MSDIEKIKQLRQSTGAGYKDCNSALKESSGHGRFDQRMEPAGS